MIANPRPDPVWALGLPLVPFTMRQTVEAVGELIERGQPSFFITANLNYAMLTDRDSELPDVNLRAAFVVADGMPLLWAAKAGGHPLPERIAGSDLIFSLAAEAAANGWRVFLIGGREGVAAEAARRLCDRYPGLTIVGIEVPPFRQQSPAEAENMFARIRSTKPDLLIGAFSQPFGEKWLAANLSKIGVPACVQLGASFDFVAGRVKRCPPLIARLGLEWAFRFAVEPLRLGGRYFQNGWFLLWNVLWRRTPSTQPACRP
jgi:N-acetylglucosaminyldiphosphoundecaprenol N-acetyl-beta-D-mannosaminyltransferase